MLPTVHANWRYFEMYDAKGNIADQWFGGGLDLTPYYLFEKMQFTSTKCAKAACDRHDPTFIRTIKKRCDDYFWNAHRNEARGVGGLFFDYLKPTQRSMEAWYAFVTDVADHFSRSLPSHCRKKKRQRLYSRTTQLARSAPRSLCGIQFSTRQRDLIWT